MRRLPKTEQQADHRRMVGLEDQEHVGAYSVVSNKSTMMSGTKFQKLVLDRNNLNLAY